MLAVSDSLINESGDPIRPKKGRIVTSNELEQWRRYCELLNRIKNSEEYMDVTQLKAEVKSIRAVFPNWPEKI